ESADLQEFNEPLLSENGVEIERQTVLVSGPNGQIKLEVEEEEEFDGHALEPIPTLADFKIEDVEVKEEVVEDESSIELPNSENSNRGHRSKMEELAVEYDLPISAEELANMRLDECKQFINKLSEPQRNIAMEIRRKVGNAQAAARFKTGKRTKASVCVTVEQEAIDSGLPISAKELAQMDSYKYRRFLDSLSEEQKLAARNIRKRVLYSLSATRRRVRNKATSCSRFMLPDQPDSRENDSEVKEKPVDEQFSIPHPHPLQELSECAAEEVEEMENEELIDCDQSATGDAPVELAPAPALRPPTKCPFCYFWRVSSVEMALHIRDCHPNVEIEPRATARQNILARAEDTEKRRWSMKSAIDYNGIHTNVASGTGAPLHRQPCPLGAALALRPPVKCPYCKYWNSSGDALARHVRDRHTRARFQNAQDAVKRLTAVCEHADGVSVARESDPTNVCDISTSFDYEAASRADSQYIGR
ncbi:hypothetical protein PFISCL1PPCAC_4404, partial [Pristionchus fissidentatus]